MELHAFVIWPAATFRYHPINNLIRIGDITRLAVHAIGGFDFLVWTGRSRPGYFVNRHGTKILAGIAIFHDAFRRANI